MSGKLILLMFCGLMLACARPVYQEITASPTTGNAQQSGPGSVDKLTAADASLSQLGLKLSLVWIKNQTDEEAGSFLLKFWRPNKGDQSPVLQDVAPSVEVRLWMPSMGHGASPVRVQRIDVGTYQVDDVYFSMAGDWEIQIDLKNGNEVIDAAKIPVHF
jgi:hypothetical protein